MNRGVKVMHRRYLKIYLDRWAQKNKHENKQKEGSELLLKKIRNRFLRQGFNLYLQGCARDRLEVRNDSSCDQLRRALNTRLLKKCFNAIKGFNDKNLKAKRYWKILLGKMDHWMKKRAFATWMDGGNTVRIEQCLER